MLKMKIQQVKQNALLIAVGAILLFNSNELFAQSAEARDEARAEKMIAALEQKVALDDAQKSAIKKVLMDNQLEFRKERESASGDKLLLFRLANERIKKIDSEIQALLRDDQREGYQAAKDEIRQAMREKN
jgi:hypothetical protein